MGNPEFKLSCEVMKHQWTAFSNVIKEDIKNKLVAPSLSLDDIVKLRTQFSFLNELENTILNTVEEDKNAR